MEHWGKYFSEKSPQNMFKTRLDTFGDDFGHVWNFETFLIFWKIFEDSTLHGTLGKNFFRKNQPKTSSKHVWTLWERIWAFLEFWKFLDFFEIFRRLDPPWNTGQKFFFGKINPKLVQNTFGHFWERFWAFLEIWIFFWFWKFSFGHFWGRFWAFLERWNYFWSFWKLSKTRPSIEHWAKSFFERITLKHLQNTFGQFWERFWAFLEFWKIFWLWKFSFGLFWGRFWAFLEFWNFFDFFESFRRLDPPWNTAQKIFSKKSP